MHKCLMVEWHHMQAEPKRKKVKLLMTKDEIVLNIMIKYLVSNEEDECVR